MKKGTAQLHILTTGGCLMLCQLGRVGFLNILVVLGREQGVFYPMYSLAVCELTSHKYSMTKPIEANSVRVPPKACSYDQHSVTRNKCWTSLGPVFSRSISHDVALN